MSTTAEPPTTARPADAPADAAGAASLPPTTVILPDGARLAYRETGAPGGIAVVLLHEPSEAWRSYQPILERLPATMHAFAVTPRGHEGAGAPAGGRSVEQLAADALAFMDAVGLDHAVLVGHSFGAAVALRAAALGGVRIDGVVALGTLVTVTGLDDPVDPGETGLLGLDRVVAPALLLRGEHDDLVPAADHQRLADAIRGAELRTYPDAGHALHRELPERVAADLVAFVAACETRTVRRVNGVSLLTRTLGDGEPMVLVHGSWSDHHTWDAVLPALARVFRVTVYDRSGHSRSERRAHGSTRRMEEDDLATLISALGTGPAHLVASSYGASIALGLACRHPELVRSLAVHEPVLIGLVVGAASHDGDDGVEAGDAVDLADVAAIETTRAQLAAVGERLRVGDVDGGVRAFMEDVVLGPGAWALVPERMRATMAANAPTFLDMLADPAWADLDPAVLRALRVPVLLTDGDTSLRWLRVATRAVERHVQGVVRRTFAGAAHSPHVTHPDQLAAAVIEHARATAARATGASAAGADASATGGPGGG